MKTLRYLPGICLASSIVLCGVGSAQGRPIELGMDGAVSVSSGDGAGGGGEGSVQTWAFPAQRFRMAVSPADRFQLQLTMAFSVADFGASSTVRFTLGLAGAYHLTGDGVRSGLFVSGGGALNLLSQNGSDTQWTVGGGFGYKVPLGDRLAFRPALEVTRSSASALRFGNTTISGLAGLSFFTK